MTVMFGGRETNATIVEDCGNVGWNGRHIVRIAIDLDESAARCMHEACTNLGVGV